MSRQETTVEELVLLVKRLEEQFPVTELDSYKPLVNFSQNRSLPIHSWFDYKQGYSPELIQKLVEDLSVPKDGIILDPFNGVGTTLLAADSIGIESFGFDVNPVAVLASEVKNRKYSKKDLTLIKDLLEGFSRRKPKGISAPKYKSLPRIYKDEELKDLLVIRAFVDAQAIDWVRRFLLLAFVSIVEPVSNRIKDGNGIKIAKNKKPVEDIFGLYNSKVMSMISDLNVVQPSGLGKTIFGSILDDQAFEKIRDLRFDAAIYSPPYANCFDYLEVYKMEMWMGGFVSEYSDFAQYRNASVRSHVNSSFSKFIAHEDLDVNLVTSALTGVILWNKNIPSMVAGYFDDMTGVLTRTFEVLKVGGASAIVVANSSYQGIIVPTDLLLAKIAKEIGFTVESINKARAIRGSSQHMARQTKFDGLMRESIIILRK
jgi:DNA modification methylase